MDLVNTGAQIIIIPGDPLGFPGGSDGKASAYNVGDRIWSLGWEDPLEKKWQPTPVLLPGKSHGWRSVVGYSPWGHKELDMTEWLHYHYHLLSKSMIK